MNPIMKILPTENRKKVTITDLTDEDFVIASASKARMKMMENDGVDHIDSLVYLTLRTKMDMPKFMLVTPAFDILDDMHRQVMDQIRKSLEEATAGMNKPAPVVLPSKPVLH
jgi:hypothetical protein